MKFEINSGNILKGLNKNFNYFNQSIIEKIPSHQNGLNIQLLYRPKIKCFIDLTGDIEEFAKIRSIEMYLKDNKVNTDFRYKPLLEHQFQFVINYNIVHVFSSYFEAIFEIKDIGIHQGSLTAKINRINK